MPTYLVEPSRQKFNEQLWDDRGWDILFFAGHSSSQPGGNTGKMYINSQESLTITDLNFALQKAIERGLQLAIFNSCDGLGIARDLAQLQIPQIIAMREPVPDFVAKEFLKYFLTFFSSGKNLYLAVREAREKLHGLENSFPCASWLPVICQNPAVEPPMWDKLWGSISNSPKTVSVSIESKRAERLKRRQNEIGENGEAILDRQEFKNRRDLLAQVKNEVEGRLKQSLHNVNPINLQKEEQPYQVKRPWDAEIKIGTQSSTPLPSERDIIDVFEQPEIAGKLLILGKPGAGKTTTLLELAKELVSIAEIDASAPIPVLFNLSDWKETSEQQFMNRLIFFSLFLKTILKKDFKPRGRLETKTISEWLMCQLKEKYGVSFKIAKKWIYNRQILPLLDGLDELESGLQEHCVKAINDFMASEYRSAYLVACCRREEYENHTTKLRLNGAICLQPLIDRQIQDYLMQFGYQELWHSIKNDLDIFELAKSPLLLSIMTLAYKEISVEEWQNYQTAELRRKYLFDAYIRRMLKRDIDTQNLAWNATDEQTKHWLTQLAKILRKDARTEFLIETIQTEWFETTNQKWIYRLGIFISIGFICLIITQIFLEFLMTLVNLEHLARVFGLMLGIIVIIFNILDLNIKPTEIVKFSFQKSLSGLQFNLVFCLVLGGILAWRTNIFMGFKLGVGSLLAALLINSVEQADLGMELRTIPNQGIWRSFTNAVALFILVCFSSGFSNWLLWGQKDISTALIAGLTTGLGIGIWYGGAACIKHFILRLILWQSGSIPWNYARFLNYATDRLFLQRIGGRYRFMHDLLREHFAGGSPENKCLHILTEHTESVRAVAISQDGQFFFSASFDNTIRFWCLPTGKLQHTITELRRVTEDTEDTPGTTFLAISTDARLKILASCGNDGIVNLWELSSRKVIYSFPKNSDSVWRIAISRDGQTLAAGCDDGTIRLWNLKRRELVCTFSKHSDAVRSIVFSPDGQTLATCSSDNTIKLWNLQTRKLQFTLLGNSVRKLSQRLRALLNRWGVSRSGTIYAVTFTPDGQTLISGSAGNGVELWNPFTGKLLRTLSGYSNWIQSVAMSPDGRILAGGTGEGAIDLWNFNTGELLSTIKAHSDTVNSLAFSPDGQTLVSGSDDKTIKIWQISPSISQQSFGCKRSKISWAKLAPLIMGLITMFYIFVLFAFPPTIISSDSTGAMAPTFRNNELLIVDNLTIIFAILNAEILYHLKLLPV